MTRVKRLPGTHFRDSHQGAGHVGLSACAHIPDRYVCTNNPGTVSLPYQVRNGGNMQIPRSQRSAQQVFMRMQL